MFKTRGKILVIALSLATIAGADSFRRASSAEGEGKERAKDSAQVKEIAGYRQWARITPQLLQIDFPSVMG